MSSPPPVAEEDPDWSLCETPPRNKVSKSNNAGVPSDDFTVETPTPLKGQSAQIKEYFKMMYREKYKEQEEKIREILEQTAKIKQETREILERTEKAKQRALEQTEKAERAEKEQQEQAKIFQKQLEGRKNAVNNAQKGLVLLQDVFQMAGPMLSQRPVWNRGEPPSPFISGTENWVPFNPNVNAVDWSATEVIEYLSKANDIMVHEIAGQGNTKVVSLLDKIMEQKIDSGIASRLLGQAASGSQLELRDVVSYLYAYYFDPLQEIMGMARDSSLRGMLKLNHCIAFSNNDTTHTDRLKQTYVPDAVLNIHAASMPGYDIKQTQYVCALEEDDTEHHVCNGFGQVGVAFKFPLTFPQKVYDKNNQSRTDIINGSLVAHSKAEWAAVTQPLEEVATYAMYGRMKLYMIMTSFEVVLIMIETSKDDDYVMKVSARLDATKAHPLDNDWCMPEIIMRFLLMSLQPKNSYMATIPKRVKLHFGTVIGNKYDDDINNTVPPPFMCQYLEIENPDAIYLGTGRTGPAIRNTVHEEDVVAKMLYLTDLQWRREENSPQTKSEELDREREVYKHCIELQGDCIPIFRAHLMAFGAVEMLITRFAGDKIKDITPTIVRKARSALENCMHMV